MYVLTEGWYSDRTVMGVTSDEYEAIAWSDSGDHRSYDGPFSDGLPE